MGEGEKPRATHFDYEPSPKAVSTLSQREKAKKFGRTSMTVCWAMMKEYFAAPLQLREQNLDCCRDMILHENTVMGLGIWGQ